MQVPANFKLAFNIQQAPPLFYMEKEQVYLEENALKWDHANVKSRKKRKCDVRQHSVVKAVPGGLMRTWIQLNDICFAKNNK